MTEVFSIQKPDKPWPLIFDSPHSGAYYPDDFAFTCAAEALWATEDKFVDTLFDHVGDFGFPYLTAHYPRCYLDLNRRIDDIDPHLFDGDWPAELYGPIRPSSRSDAGIGLIWRLLKPGSPIYSGSLTPDEIAGRIERCYRPYHVALQNLVQEAHYNYGQAWHINCHSMPVETARPRRIRTARIGGGQPVDICLGDRDGTTATADFVRFLRGFFEDRGYSVSVNDPFKGVEIIRKTGAPGRGIHAVQLEINKALYMDEKTFQTHEGYHRLKDDLAGLAHACRAYIDGHLQQNAAD